MSARNGPFRMSRAGIFNLRDHDGQRQQQTRQQGSEETQTGKAEGSGHDEFRCGQTRFPGRQERQVNHIGASGQALALSVAGTGYPTNETAPSRRSALIGMQDGGTIARSASCARNVGFCHRHDMCLSVRSHQEPVSCRMLRRHLPLCPERWASNSPWASERLLSRMALPTAWKYRERPTCRPEEPSASLNPVPAAVSGCLICPTARPTGSPSEGRAGWEPDPSADAISRSSRKAVALAWRISPSLRMRLPRLGTTFGHQVASWS